MLSIPAVGDLATSRNAPAASTAAPPPAAGPANPALQADAHGAALNPSLRLDLSLDLVIMEFHSSSGTVTETIPSDRQLNAYRIAGVPGRRPNAPTDAATADPPPLEPSSA